MKLSNGGSARIIERAWADTQRRRALADTIKIIALGCVLGLSLTAIWGLVW